jgi:spore coat polysaccharide biosynthesis predicted glycosyltransferase SpsG
MTRTTKPRAKRTLEEMRELAAGAKAILADPAFLHAREELRERLVNALVAAQSTEEKLDIVASLKCLMQIAAEIAVLMNDYRVAADRARGARPS